MPPSHRNVLLVEEYDALAVAIESALRKFAPEHRVDVVASLSEAQPLAIERRPELIIVDFDPPQAGAVTFFNELAPVLPGTRVLVVAAGVSRNVVIERGSKAALQFIDKPFELLDFGATVQALLGAWRETGSSRGTLRNLTPADVAILGCISGRSSVIQVDSRSGERGELHCHNGHISHAAQAELQGQPALDRIFSWSGSRFKETSAPVGKRTIYVGWPVAIIRALREASTSFHPSATNDSPAELASPFSISNKPAGKKVLIIDDTEMLLIFVKDSLTDADPDLQIATAATGLDGVNEASRLIPDLVVVDYSLPDITGDEVCRRIGTNDLTARVPIIMMSGHVQEMSAAAEKLPNVVATIAKPFLSEALIALVTKILAAGPLPEPAKFPAERPDTGDRVTEPVRELTTESAVAKAGDGGNGHRVDKTPVEAGHPPSGPQPGPGNQAQSPSGNALAPQLSPNEVLLELPLEVIAMQVNSSFQIGSIRARPASPTVAIEIPALAARTALPVETAFQLGPIELDAQGRISTMRLLPTPHRFHTVETGNAFEIGGVMVVPANERERLQLLSVATSRMSMQLFAPLQLVSVELSDGLEVKELVLRCRSSAVRVTLNSETSETHSDACFETTAVQLDESRHLAELTLAPMS